jgi:hypothetical protein
MLGGRADWAACQATCHSERRWHGVPGLEKSPPSIGCSLIFNYGSSLGGLASSEWTCPSSSLFS